MKITLNTLVVATALNCVAAQATLIDTVGYGVQYKFGALGGGNIVDQELAGITSIQREQAIGNQSIYTRTAKVRGDLATGSIGAQSRVFSNNTGATGQAGSPGGDIKIVDTLRFDLTGFAPGSTYDIDIGLDWEGLFFPAIGGPTTQDLATLSFGLTSEDDSLEMRQLTAEADYFLLFGLNPDFQVGDPITFGDIGFRVGFPGLIGDWDPRDPRDGMLNGLFSLQTGKVTTVDFTMRMQVFGNADFYNSAHLSFDSPVPFTSASGTFMSSAGAAPDPTMVSEPNAALLLFSGLLGLIARNRLRKKHPI